MSNPSRYVLNVVSNDHPGIVAAVSAAIHEIGGNIESCSQTVLDGHFTFILVISLPTEMDTDVLTAKIKEFGSLHKDYKIVSLPVSQSENKASSSDDSDLFVITAFGKDRPGVIKNISKYLADKKINIVDFYSRSDNGEFTMMGQVAIPNELDLQLLQDDLEELGGELEFTVKLQHNNIFVATNELRLQ